jgi:Lrp/AsnC family transcriptional regulator of ectoine degradation
MASPRLDPIDLRILTAIQRDGRITQPDLAELVGISPRPCSMRLRKLEKAGIITGYHARLAMHRIAPIATVLMEVTLSTHRRADFERFERAVQDMEEVVSCWSVGGGVDYILKIMTPDIAAYQLLVDALLERELGIDRYFTYIVIKTVKDDDVLPLEMLLEQNRAP